MRRARIQEQGEASQVEASQLADDERRRPEHGGITGQLLALQRSVGNRAVGSLLAREPATEEKGDGGAQDDKVPKGAVPGTITFPDPIGSMPIESLQLGGATEVAISVPVGPTAPKLMEYGQNGTYIAKVVIEAAGFTITMDDVVIASVQQSGAGPDGGGGSFHLTLSFGMRAIKRDPDPDAKGTPDQPRFGDPIGGKAS